MSDSKKYHNHQFSLEEGLSEMIQDFKLESGLTEQRIWEVWRELMDEYTVNNTRSLQLQDKVLVIRVESAILRQELAMNKSRLLQLLNKSLEHIKLEDIQIY